MKGLTRSRRTDPDPVPGAASKATIVKRILVEWPAKIVDGVWLAYKILLLAASLLALGCAGIALVAYLLFGLRVFW